MPLRYVPAWAAAVESQPDLMAEQATHVSREWHLSAHLCQQFLSFLSNL